MAKSPNLVLDTPVAEWIAAFNRERGWKSLRGKSNSKPDAKNLRVSPKKQLEDESDYALDGYDKEELEDLVSRQEIALEQIDDQIENAGPDDDISELQEDREELILDLEINKADLVIVDRVEERIAQLRAVEGHLHTDLRATRSEIRRLEQLDEASDFSPEDADQDLLARFRQQHVMVQNNVERARGEVMKVTTEGGGKTRSYAIINNIEYKILFGMLEQAILIVGTGDIPAAITRVEEAQTKLNEYRTARTGATAMAAPPDDDSDSEHGALQGPMAELAAQIAMLNDKGFVEAANKLEVAFDALSFTVKDAAARNDPDIRKNLLPLVDTQNSEAVEARNLALQVLQIEADIGTDIATMRANGHRVRPARSERELAACQTRTRAMESMGDALEATRDAAEIIRARLERTKAQDLRRSKLKPDEMQAELTQLEDKFEDFFKHKRSGERRTQTDTKSQEQKGKKKNSDLPRAALEEIELQILAAKQLVQSDSVDALKTADEYLTGVNNFLAAIEENPKIYVDLGKGFDGVEDAIGKIKGKFPLYEPGRLLDFKAELDALRAGHITQPHEEVKEDTADILARVAAFRAEVVELQVLKRALAKQADGVDKTIATIGKRLSKDQKGFVKFDGYYGPEVARMDMVRDQIAERSPASLNKAATALIEIGGNLGWLASLLKKRKAGDELDDTEQEHIAGLVSVARSGQMEHDANQAKKKEFETGIKNLTNIIDAAKRVLTKLKADPNEITSLEAERDGLKAETEKSGGYIEGVDKLEGLRSRALQISENARKASEILDGDLATAATKSAQAVALFAEKLSTFVEDIIEPAGETYDANQLDQPPYDAAKIRDFFTKLKGSLDKVDIAEMRAQSRRVADNGLSREDRKMARKTALQELRKLMGLFDSFAPMQHFDKHPFAKGDASTRLVDARQALPRLEKRLLTAIKD